MKYRSVLLLLVLLYRYPAFTQGQSNDTGNDYLKLYKTITDEYGFDQVLVNGIFYEDEYRNKTGHQFFMADRFYKGSLTFRGKEYKGIEMKYDIYDNQLILNVKNNISAAWVVPPNDFITNFSLDGKFFSEYNLRGEKRFYQVVFDSGNLKCLCSWQKKMHESYDNNSIIYEFFKSEKKYYLVLNDSLLTYRNNRSFLGIIPEESRAPVRRYIKGKHIKVNKSDDKIISDLFVYFNSLL